MASVTDYGGTGDPLNSPALGGPTGWAAAVAAALNNDDTTVDARIAAAGSTHVNVKAYGATGDGSTDDSTAIKAAVAAAIGSYSAGANQRPTGVLYFPPGNYRVTEDDCLWPGIDPTTGNWLKMRGWHIKGDGKHASTITFDSGIVAQPTNRYEGNMMTALSGDPDSHPSAVGGATLQETVVEGLSFVSNSQYQRFAYLYCWDGRPQSDFVFRDCDWQGDWEYVFGLDGPTTTPDADQNSEMSFYNCGTRDTTTFSDAFLHAGLTNDADLDQQVNYTFVDCSFEYESGTLLKFDRGGAIRVLGGSYILGINDGSELAGSLFQLGSSSTSYGDYSTRALTVIGTRFEARHQNAKILTSKWVSPVSHLTFIGCLDASDGGSGDADWTEWVIDSGTYGTGVVKWINCIIFGGIEVTGSTPGAYSTRLGFDSCHFHNYPSGKKGPAAGTSLGSATGANATDVFTLTAHGLIDGDVVSFSGLSGLSGITAGTKYTVKSATDDTFKIRANKGSAATASTDLGSDGSATVTQHFFIQEDSALSSSNTSKVTMQDCGVAPDTAIRILTQAEYDAITTPNPFTVYVISG